MIIRTALHADLSQLVELNNANVPAVSPSDVDGMSGLLAFAHETLVAVSPADPKTVLGFAILMRPGLDYESENYRWFEVRGTDFLYVDRIVVSDRAQGRGVGGQLYAETFSIARAQGCTELTCEVNVEPPNPGSLRFHGRLGFVEVGRQSTKGDTIAVAMLAAPVEA